jgi:hypothetical protein
LIVTNDLYPADEVKTIEFKISIKKLDAPGVFPITKLDRKTTEFDLKDYAKIVGGFSLASISGRARDSISITDGIVQQLPPVFDSPPQVHFVRGNYKNGCGIN